MRYFLLAASILVLCTSVGHAQLAARPLVLLVHGRGQTERREVAEASWRDALRDGAMLVSGDTLFGDGDVAFVWYADILRPSSKAGCLHHEKGPFAAIRYGNSPQFQSFWTAARLKLVSFAAAVPNADRLLVRRHMNDVYTYLSSLRRQCAVDDRLIRAVDAATRQHRPIVLVAHSLGSLVAYNILFDWSRPPLPRVSRLVTIGSMLGFPQVYQALFGSMRNPPLPFPETVGDWWNVRNGLDMLAVPVSSVIASSSSSGGVVDTMTRTPSGVGAAHDALRYLRDPVVAAAVARAWCDSFPPVATRPAACSKVP